MNIPPDSPWRRILDGLALWGWLIPMGLFVVVLLLGGLAALFYQSAEEATPPASVGTLAPALPLESVWLEKMTNLTSNTAWQPIMQTIDGVEMVLVPKGCFVQGVIPDSTQAALDRQICFEAPFWLDRYEVSNAHYLAVQQGKTCESRWCEDDFPRANISWAEAEDFCRLRGGRLPTAAEWEYAARGVENWLYPWGMDFDPTKTVYRDLFTLEGEGNIRPQPYAVDALPESASWVGAEQMLGNVQEWVADEAAEGRHSLRGGSALNNTLDALTETRFGTLAEITDYNGFRCWRQ